MKNTKDMILQETLWAGLNRPNSKDSNADILIFGIPFDGSVSFRSGAKEAPRALREISYTITPTTEDFESYEQLEIKDLGDMGGENRDEIFAMTREKVSEIVSRGQFFTMIGGDHSTTIPVLQGIDDAVDEPFGIIHIDAHFDLCEEMGGDPLSHGSTERRALDLEHIDGVDNLFFIGIRSIEMDERELLKKHPVNVINAHTYSRIGTQEVVKQVVEKMKGFSKVYITLDIDCLDPAYAAGTGTPQFGGLTGREVLDLLRGLFQLPVIGFDVVEVAPALDPSLSALFAARKIVTECWGHYARKEKIIEEA
jgi:agmatinase